LKNGITKDRTGWLDERSDEIEWPGRRGRGGVRWMTNKSEKVESVEKTD